MEAKTFDRFEGNCPRNVSRDAKYSVRHEDGQFVVGLVYRTSDGEQWYPVSDDHPELVEMVNEVKEQSAGSPGGSFYINEYQQVIVPSAGNDKYYLAGEYAKPLVFNFEDHELSGDAKGIAGDPIVPGAKWDGPHPGIPYVLKAGGRDIYYEIEPRPNVTRKISLSDCRNSAIVERVCGPIVEVKGHEGGRFYINEFRHLFAPITADSVVEFIYIGKLENFEDWFPKPHSNVE